MHSLVAVVGVSPSFNFRLSACESIIYVFALLRDPIDSFAPFLTALRAAPRGAKFAISVIELLSVGPDKALVAVATNDGFISKLYTGLWHITLSLLT